MKFGYFDDANREYVITNPKTPWPWINYLGNEDFFSLISNTAGGYSFFKDAKFRRITRYRYNNVPMDAGGKYFYIKDGDTVWNPGWKPTKTALDAYACRHGMGYTSITGEKNGLVASILLFVPLKTHAEVQKLTLKNTTKKAKKVKLFSFLEWCLWNASTDMENFQRNFSTGEVEVEGSVIYHKTEYKERRNHYAFYGVNADIAGFDTDRETFVGLYNGFDEPEVVLAGKARNSIAHGWSPIASHALDVTLKAEGESLRKRSAVLEMLDQKIPNPIIFRVFDEEGGELETAVYPKSKAGVLYGESPVYRYCRSNKFIDFPQGLTSLESVLMALAAELGGMKVRAGESLKDFDARHYALESLRADLNDLEKRIKKESQLDRKYELAKERQSLERRIADVQS